MFNNVALNVFIGLICIFLLYSLLASILMEAVAKQLCLRQRNTLKAIYKLLDDSNYTEHGIIRRYFQNIWGTRFFEPLKGRPFTALFYAHPNIKNLGKNSINRKPSSITPEMFSDTLIQILRGDEFIGQQNQIDLIKANLRFGTINLTEEEPSISQPFYYRYTKYQPVGAEQLVPDKNQTSIQRIKINRQTYYQLTQLIYNSHSDIDWFKKSLITWFNEMMDRSEGWYIKQTRSILFIIGFVIAIAFNVDTIAISKKLANDKDARNKMIEFATTISKDNQFRGNVDVAESNEAFKQAFEKANESITQAQNIIGEKSNFQFSYEFFTSQLLKSLTGWLITAFALSLGASFWFDLLGKIMCIRQGGNNSSTDTQKKTDKTITNPAEEPIG